MRCCLSEFLFDDESEVKSPSENLSEEKQWETTSEGKEDEGTKGERNWGYLGRRYFSRGRLGKENRKSVLWAPPAT